MATAAELKAQAGKLASEARAAEQAAKELRAQARDQERRERMEKRAREAKEHYDRMYSKIGQPLAGLTEAQHSIVYTMAYDRGHSSGYEEIEGHYGELAEMARRIIDLEIAK